MTSSRQTLPRGDARHQQILDVAFRSFSDNGSRQRSRTGFHNSGNAVSIVKIRPL